VSARENEAASQPQLRMYLVSCSCRATFAVAEDRDSKGAGWSRYLKCPSCGKRHDPKNRLLQVGFQNEGYWKVEQC
jgi:hypothetical protein